VKCNVQILEKVISSLLILWGGSNLYFIISWIRFLHDLGLQYKSVLLLRDYHLLFLVALLSVVGGILMLLRKRIGWIICLVMLLVNALLYLIPAEKGKRIFNNGTSLLVFSVIAIVFLILFSILASSPYREKYLSNRNTWLIVVVATIVAVLDKLVFYFASE